MASDATRSSIAPATGDAAGGGKESGSRSVKLLADRLGISGPLGVGIDRVTSLGDPSSAERETLLVLRQAADIPSLRVGEQGLITCLLLSAGCVDSSRGFRVGSCVCSIKARAKCMRRPTTMRRRFSDNIGGVHSQARLDEIGACRRSYVGCYKIWSYIGVARSSVVAGRIQSSGIGGKLAAPEAAPA